MTRRNISKLSTTHRCFFQLVDYVYIPRRISGHDRDSHAYCLGDDAFCGFLFHQHPRNCCCLISVRDQVRMLVKEEAAELG